MEDAEFAEEMQISAASAFSMFLVRVRSNLSRHLIDHPAYAVAGPRRIKPSHHRQLDCITITSADAARGYLPVHDRQVFAPRTDRLAVLLPHDPRDLHDVAKVVRHPGGEQLA